MKQISKWTIILILIAIAIGNLWGRSNNDVSTLAAAGEVPTATEILCGYPQPEYAATCQQWEEEILATTVRIQVSGWLASAEENTATWTRLETEIGHGTVKNGRYLVTHNHYKIPFDLLAAGRVTGLVSLFTSAGELILSKADINIVSVVYEDSQTLVLAFQTETGAGLFDQLGIPSASFEPWKNLPLQAGQEVAQLDWDGAAVYVDWVEIQTVKTDNETPKLELDNFNEIGSSGGGVFWQGVHIANNWQRTTEHEKGGTAVLRQFSSAALNNWADLEAVGEIPTAIAHSIRQVTVQITMIQIQWNEETPANGNEKTVTLNAVRHIDKGIGTLLAYLGKTLLISHNHWSQLTSMSVPDLVQFHDADGRFLLEMTGDAFSQLMLFRDGGALIMRTPPSLTAQLPRAAEMGHVASLRPGDLVYMAHRQANQNDTVVLMAAEVLAIEFRNNVPLLSLHSLNGQTIEPGDSGGGVWLDGRFVGNLWMTVRKVQKEWWPFNQPVETTTARSYAAGMTEDVLALVSIVLEPQELPTLLADGPS